MIYQLIEQLTKLLGEKPTLNLFKQLLRQFDDIKQFIYVRIFELVNKGNKQLIKSKLNLNENTSNESCLTYLLKHLENSQKEGSYDEIVIKLKRMLNCNAEALVDKVGE